MNIPAVPGPTLLALLVMALCAYRITRLIVTDSLIGRYPVVNDVTGERLHPGTGFRKWLDQFAYSDLGEDRNFVRGKIGDLFTCPFCVGFWVSVGTYFAWTEGPEWLRTGVLIFAVAGVQALLNHKGE